jgi:hypothetical protein
MKILNELEYQIQAESILRQVFTNDDPTENPFSVNIPERLIVSPWDYMETKLIEAVIIAASNSGDRNCYLTNLGRYEGEANHYYISLAELHDKSALLSHVTGANQVILDIFYWRDYIIYSDRGLWGIMISHEDFAVIGGSSEFIYKLHELVPDLDRQVYPFLEKFKSLNVMLHRDFDWIPKLLTHIYGQDKAKQLLEEMELM